METQEFLSRSERRRQYREQKKELGQKQQGSNNTVKFIFLGIVLLLVIYGSYLLFKSSSTPQPGQAVPDLGRQHVPDGTKVTYNSNPPTSGPHYGNWEKAGIYDTPLVDDQLVHSLEHGYVIISYNCQPAATGTNSSPSAELAKNDPSCRDLLKKITDLANAKGLKKLIVVPRPSLDTKIALTAWGRIDKFNDFAEKRIMAFIDAFRNRGPEQTME
ncbi:DUF3105 domain-containing protein [Candidatus Gottesmanbacteria bacterium]|nr:DUF3105 domain-containing protein [Candidatus Gottesmanbacteria bacterium]